MECPVLPRLASVHAKPSDVLKWNHSFTYKHFKEKVYQEGFTGGTWCNVKQYYSLLILHAVEDTVVNILLIMHQLRFIFYDELIHSLDIIIGLPIYFKA